MRYIIKSHTGQKRLDRSINLFGFGWLTYREILQLCGLALIAFTIVYGAVIAIGAILGFL